MLVSSMGCRARQDLSFWGQETTQSTLAGFRTHRPLVSGHSERKLWLHFEVTEIVPPPPTIHPDGGHFVGSVWVTVTAVNPLCGPWTGCLHIRCTVDGSRPTLNSPLGLKAFSSSTSITLELFDPSFRLRCATMYFQHLPTIPGQ